MGREGKQHTQEPKQGHPSSPFLTPRDIWGLACQTAVPDPETRVQWVC